MRRSYAEGSITVEASFSVPAFFLVLFAMMYLFEITGQQLSVQKRLSEQAKRYAAFGVKSVLLDSGEGDYLPVQWETEKKPMICYCDYRRNIPVIGSDFFQAHIYQQVVVNSYCGRSMVPDKVAEGEGYAYLSEYGRVYHLDAACTYLNPGIERVAPYLLEKRRNQSGGTYKACESCCRGQSAGIYSFVYITPYGDRYHRIKDCSGLRRNIRKVKRSEVGGLPPCSKCGGIGKIEEGDE